jgi:hypothetical protein
MHFGKAARRALTYYSVAPTFLFSRLSFLSLGNLGTESGGCRSSSAGAAASVIVPTRGDALPRSALFVWFFDRLSRAPLGTGANIFYIRKIAGTLNIIAGNLTKVRHITRHILQHSLSNFGPFYANILNDFDIHG